MVMRGWLLAGMLVCGLPLSSCAFIERQLVRTPGPATVVMQSRPAAADEYAQAIFNTSEIESFDRLQWDLSVVKLTPGARTRWSWDLWSQFERGPGFTLGLRPRGESGQAPMAVLSFLGTGTEGHFTTCTSDKTGEQRTTCRLPLAWTPGATYRFDVRRSAETTAARTTWTATVTDLDKGDQPMTIGIVSVPADRGQIRPSTQGYALWEEGDVVGCQARGSFAARLNAPIGYKSGRDFPEVITRGNSTACVTVFPDGPESAIMQTKLGNDAPVPPPTPTKAKRPA